MINADMNSFLESINYGEEVDILYKNADNSLKRAEKDIQYSEEMSLDSADDFDSLDLRIDMINKKEMYLFPSLA